MKYCAKCGAEIMDEAVVCPKCGCLVDNGESKKNASSDNSTLKTIAKVFMIVGTISLGFGLIPLAWCIPMTLSYWRKVENHEPVSLAFKICTLIFVNAVAGILMLCDNED